MLGDMARQAPRHNPDRGNWHDGLLALAAALALVLAVAVSAYSPAALIASAALGLGLLLYRHIRRTQRLDRRNRDLEKSVRSLEVAEGLAGIGRWCIEVPSWKHLWSEEMCHIAGLAKGTAPSEVLLERLMPDGMQQLRVTLDAHETDSGPFVAEFELVHGNGTTRILRARARNVFGPEGERERIFMVVRDVTEEYAYFEEVERERKRALAMAAEARREANTDALTGMASRRAIMAELDRTALDAQRGGKPFSVIVFDIDHFKQINDTYGHATGDKVLVKLAEIVIRQARGADLVGRIGGEEFLWLLPGCDEQAARDAAERLRWAIEAGSHSAPIPDVTISAGHATQAEGEGALSLFARADAGLYDAKRAGRNRVAVAA